MDESVFCYFLLEIFMLFIHGKNDDQGALSPFFKCLDLCDPIIRFGGPIFMFKKKNGIYALTFAMAATGTTNCGTDSFSKACTVLPEYDHADNTDFMK